MMRKNLNKFPTFLKLKKDKRIWIVTKVTSTSEKCVLITGTFVRKEREFLRIRDAIVSKPLTQNQAITLAAEENENFDVMANFDEMLIDRSMVAFVA